MRHSFAEYVRIVARLWWSLAVGGVAAGFAAVSAFKTGLVVPWWVGLAVAGGALSWVQFRAFHLVRIQRDASASGVLQLEAIGIVNGLGPNYWPGRAGRPVDAEPDAWNHGAEAPELYLRVAVRPSAYRVGVDLTKEIKDDLRAKLDSSALAWWLARRTGVASSWALTAPSTHRAATVVREGQRDAGGHATLYGDCRFLLPIGLQGIGAVLMVDVVFRPDRQPEADSPFFRLSTLDVYELAHALLGTVVDELVPAIFPQVSARRGWLRRQLPPHGPSLFLAAFGQKNLGDFIDLSDLDRAPGADAGSINQYATIETPRGARMETFADRDALIKTGLTRFLAASQFVDPVTPIETLSIWPGLRDRLVEARQRR